jgi:Ca2+-binding EF-hand superfamily protein
MEILRCRLSVRPYMNLRDLFETCTRSRTGLILSSDIRDVLAEHGFYSTERELQGLMFRLDGD